MIHPKYIMRYTHMLSTKVHKSHDIFEDYGTKKKRKKNWRISISDIQKHRIESLLNLIHSILSFALSILSSKMSEKLCQAIKILNINLFLLCSLRSFQLFGWVRVKERKWRKPFETKQTSHCSTYHHINNVKDGKNFFLYFRIMDNFFLPLSLFRSPK